jgi:hypothetical protein
MTGFGYGFKGCPTGWRWLGFAMVLSLTTLVPACSSSGSSSVPTGVENRTKFLLRAVSIQVDGKDGFTFCTLAAGQAALHMNPTWKMPRKIRVAGSIEGKSGFAQEVTVPVTRSNNVEILLVIEEKQGDIKCNVELRDRNN